MRCAWRTLTRHCKHGKNLLALATRAAGISSWELDLKTRTTLWTENEIESLRAAGVDSQRQPNAVLELTHPEDVSILSDAVRKAVDEGKEICTFRFRVVTPIHTIVHLEAHARIFCSEQGEPLRILGVSWDVTDQVVQENATRTSDSMRDASRRAGMAEVATGVLHSVGNVLNSLGVSTSLVQSRLRDSRSGNVRRIAAQLIEQGDQVGNFLANDARGRQSLNYLAQLGDRLSAENQHLKAEAEAIATHVGHIRTIVAANKLTPAAAASPNPSILRGL